MRRMTWRALSTRPYSELSLLSSPPPPPPAPAPLGRGLHSFTLEVNLRNSRTHS